VGAAAGGCWEVFAPTGPSGASRQDLWFPSARACSGGGWGVALAVFADGTALSAAARQAAATSAVYRDGFVLVVVTAAAGSVAQRAVAAQPGLSAIAPGP